MTESVMENIDETDEDSFFLSWDAVAHPAPAPSDADALLQTPISLLPFSLVAFTGGCSPYTLLRRKACSRVGASLYTRAENLLDGGVVGALARALDGSPPAAVCAYAALALRNLALCHPPLHARGAAGCVHSTAAAPAARCCDALPALLLACAPHVAAGEQRVALALARAVRALCTGHDGARRAACQAAVPLLRDMVAAPGSAPAGPLVRRAAVEALAVARGWGAELGGEPPLAAAAALVAELDARDADDVALEDAASECRVFLCCACPDAACKQVDVMAEAVVRAGAPARLAALLRRGDAPSLQREAAMCLANIAAGLAVHAEAASCGDALPLLAALLEAPSHSVRAAGAWALGNIAGHGGPLRDAVLAQRTAPLVCRALEPADTHEHLLSVCGFAIRGMVGGKNRPPWGVTRVFVPALLRLLGCAGPAPAGGAPANAFNALNVSAEDALWTLSMISTDKDALEAVTALPAVLPHAVALCRGATSRGLAHAALRFLGNAAYGGAMVVQRLLDAGGASAIVAFLYSLPLPTVQPDEHLPPQQWQIEALWSLSNIAASEQPHKQALLDTGCLPRVLELLGSSGGERAAAREHAAWLVSNLLSGCTGEQQDAVAALGAARVLSGALAAWVADAHRTRTLGGTSVDALEKLLLRRPGGWAAGPQLLMDAGAPEPLEALVDHLLALPGGGEGAPGNTRALLQAERMLRLLPCGLAPRRVFFTPPPPAEVAARVASCSECWHATPRRECPPRAEGAPHERDACAICYSLERDDGAPVTALTCGHVLHLPCLLSWLELATRENGATQLSRKGVCPVCRAVCTRAVKRGLAVAEGWVDITSAGAPGEGTGLDVQGAALALLGGDHLGAAGAFGDGDEEEEEEVEEAEFE